MTIVAPFGFYGWGNIGDESTLQGFARLVMSRRPTPSVWVASRNRPHTRRAEPSLNYFDAGRRDLRGRWADFRAAGTVFPGGTPIMDGLGTWPLDEVAPLVTAARERGRPVVFIGTGTERLGNPSSREIVARTLAPGVEHWTLRSERDRERLASWGVDPARLTVAADLAWLLSPVSRDFGTRTLAGLGVPAGVSIIGVNVNNEAAVLQREPRLFEKVAATVDRVLERPDTYAVFFCSEVREGPSFDKAAALKVLAAMKRADRAAMVPNRYWTPQELLSIIGGCRVVLSTRYHVCLFAALQNVPFLALQRSDKVRDLCGDLGWPFGIPMEHLAVTTLVDHIDEIERRHAELGSTLRDATARQSERSRLNHIALDALVKAATSTGAESGRAGAWSAGPPPAGRELSESRAEDR
jgi:polysaccharide pyruvyl transferase WcaK-like protein